MPLDRIYWVTHHLWLFVFLQILLLYFHGLYDQGLTYGSNQIISRTFRAITLEILIMVSVYFFRQDIVFPRSIFILIWIFNIIATTFWHIIWHRIFRIRVPERNLLIVGANESAKALIREIERLPSSMLRIAGILTASLDDKNQKTVLNYPVLGTRDQLLSIVQQYNIDEVVISSEGTWQEAMIDQISRTDQIPARICVIPTCYEILIGKINHLRLYDIPLIEVIKHPKAPTGKRLGDFIVATLLFIITSPLFLLTAALIKMTSQGPVFYKQIRMGKNRVPFTIYKFRTLVEGAEDETGPVLTAEDDLRVTRTGRILRKYRLDELPQLINIMKGEMSFVGPRPERPYFIGEYINRIPGYGERFKATPGLTGLAQVNGGYATVPENKLKYDLAYIYNQSFWLDIRILRETIKVILTGHIRH
jgi:exopolysaccharide biosynthesis polyprenyl glycosylphosphotransferase